MGEQGMGMETNQPAEPTGHSVHYSIGEAARLAGVSPASVRLWEQEGLICPGRTVGGHRHYTSEDVERLRRIAYLRRVERLNAAAIRRELGPSVGAATGPAPHADPALGRRLRALRKKLGLSLAQASSQTQLSVSFLSAVERGQSGISLGNLFKLADAYGTTVPGLKTVPTRAPRRRLRPEERPRYVANQGRVLIEDLITQPGALEAQRFEIAPGGESEEAYSHPGEEFVYVVAGQLSFWVDERERYELQAGDSLYFHSTQLHRWQNGGDVPTIVLWINVPVVEEAAGGHSPRRHVARQRPRPSQATGLVESYTSTWAAPLNGTAMAPPGEETQPPPLSRGAQHASVRPNCRPRAT